MWLDTVYVTVSRIGSEGYWKSVRSRQSSIQHARFKKASDQPNTNRNCYYRIPCSWGSVYVGTSKVKRNPRLTKEVIEIFKHGNIFNRKESESALCPKHREHYSTSSPLIKSANVDDTLRKNYNRLWLTNPEISVKPSNCN